MEGLEYVWNELTLDSARFILEQAEKRAQATIETSKSLTDRAVNVMQFSVPLSLGLIGLIVAEPKGQLLLLYFVVLGLLIAISYMSLHVYDVYTIQPLGYKPGDLLSEATLPVMGTKQYLRLLFSAIQDIEKVIEINERSNQERQRALFWIMVLVKFLVPLAGAYIAMGSLIPLLPVS